MSVQLKVVQGKPLGATIPVNGSSYLIGRAAECQLRPKNEAVGEKHCRLRVEDDHVSVRDLGSDEGTSLNGQKLSPADSVIALHGDRIHVGDLVFEVEVARPRTGLAPNEPEEDELGSAAARLANELFQRTLGERRNPIQGVGVHFRATVVDGVPVIAVGLPKLAGDALVPLRRELRNLGARPGLVRVVLDLKEVRGMASEAVAIMLTFQERLGQRGGSVKLCEVAPAVMKLLDATGATARIPVALDVHDAVWSPW